MIDDPFIVLCRFRRRSERRLLSRPEPNMAGIDPLRRRKHVLLAGAIAALVNEFAVVRES